MIYENNKKPDTLGVINGQFYPLKDSPNGVSSQSSDPEKYVEPITYNDKSISVEIISDLIRKYKHAELISTNENYIHLVFKSDFFNFKDDVELYFDEEKKEIHFKSQSRIGYSDMGANRKRYKKFKNDYLQKIQE